MTKQSCHIYEFGPFRLIPEERQLLRGNQPVPLTPKCFDLLLLFLENSGHLLEKDELIARIWPDSFVEEANLSVNVSTLRRALGEGLTGEQYVETVPRRGYRFVAEVKETRTKADEPEVSAPLTETGAADQQRDSSPQPITVGLNSRAPFYRRPRFLLFAVLLIFAVVLGLSVRRLRLLSNNPLSVQSLAVLPMENLSGDAAQDYFADGMTDALINQLARVKALRVMSQGSVVQYRSAPKPLREIGHELNVDAVIKGSVVRSGERVRIAVQLIHASSGQTLWANSYERNLTDVLALQKEVARAIVGEIKIKLTPQEQVQFGYVHPVNSEAYDDYLRGQFYLLRQNRNDNDAAIAAFERAVAADPKFAEAFAELAQAYTWRLFLFAPKEQQWAEKAFVAAEKAIALDPDLALAHLALGRLIWTPANHFPHEKAIQEYRRALDLNPSLDEARNQLALVYCHIGAFDEALEESQKAVMLNPTNSLAQFRTAQTLNFKGKHEEALAALRAIPQEVNPALIGAQTTWALFNLGKKEEASVALDQLLRDYPEDSGGLFTSMQAVIAASSGQQRVAEEKIKSAIEKGKGFGHFHHTAYHIACAYALMDKPDQAIKWLQVTADDGFPCYPMFETDTNLKNLRQDSRFLSFMSKLKQQWEYYKKAVTD